MLRSAELQISRLCSAKDGAAGAGGLVLSRAWTSSWTARCFGAWQRTTDVSATTKHVRSALRMRDVDKDSAIAGDFPTTHLSATTRRNE